MAKINAKGGESASIELCDHATSLLQGIASNIHHLHLAQVNKSMHPRMVFRRVDDGFRNSINWMKDWHETIMEHLDTHKKKEFGINKGVSLVPIFILNICVIQFFIYT
jgi:hypothetical protein